MWLRGDENAFSVNEHQKNQLVYFASIDHGERFRWQTSDVFVMKREHATLKPFVDAIKQLQKTHGTVTVLESGCGEGVNFVHLQQMGLAATDISIEGIDPCIAAVEVAKSHGLNARVADGLALPYADASFDIVFCRDVLHHLANDIERVKFLAEMTRVAKPGGLIAAIEPNPGNPMILIQSFVLWAERGLRAMWPWRISRMKLHAHIISATPSAAWRALWHYRSPLRAYPRVSRVILRVFEFWEIVSKYFPKTFWSYRIYLWNT